MDANALGGTPRPLSHYFCRMAAIRYSIIIPVRKNLEGLQQTVNHILQDPTLEQWELVVVNDGGDADVAKYLDDLQEQGVPVKPIETQVAGGAYFARNRGIEASTGKFLLFFDDSLTFPADWFQRIRKPLEEVPYLSGAVAIAQKPDEKLSEKFYRLTAMKSKDYFQRQHFGLTGFLGVHRWVFEKVGMFHERLFSGGDLEFGQRVYAVGVQQGYFDGYAVYHPPKDWHMHFRALVRMFKGRRDMSYLLPERYRQLRVGFMDFWRVVKDFGGKLLFPLRHPAWGKLSPLEYYRAIISFYTLAMAAKLLVWMFPNKKFNI